MATEQDGSPPRAVIHKRILDRASEEPEISIPALAGDIPGASTDLVERVLDEYGDPAGDEAGSSNESNTPEMVDDNAPADLDDLSEPQRNTLITIFEHPEATQQELGEILGVSASTVCNRVNAIEGFDWTDRQASVETLFETRGPSKQENHTEKMESTSTEYKTTADQLVERVETLEQDVEALSDSEKSATVFADPDLLHKVLHACLKTDTITEEEELEILKSLL